jgi:hypothetical protein
VFSTNTSEEEEYNMLVSDSKKQMTLHSINEIDSGEEVEIDIDDI